MRWAMQQVLSCTLAILAAMSLTCFPALSNPPPRVPSILAAYTDTKAHPIEIDGATQDWPGRVLVHGIHFFSGDGNEGIPEKSGTTVCGKMDDRQDGEMRLWLTHDARYLYILAVIQDDKLEQRTSENNTNEAWKEDCLHLYIDSEDMRADKVADPPLASQPGYEQFGVSTDYSVYTEGCDFTTNNGPNGTAAGTGAQPDQENWKVGIKIHGQGPYTYVFEERIPLNEVKGKNLRTMKPGDTYGFEAEFCDSDAGVFLEGWMFWSSDGKTDAYIDEDLWGRMTLEAIPLAGASSIPRKRG
jgi:hypothetical protein